jgi:aryl-alcohol dehydrogenase-like predicted oxidoreductase
VIGYFSLASGFLTGKYRSEADLSKSQRGGRVKKYLNESGFRILKALDELAASIIPHLRGSLWLGRLRPSTTAPIASATNPEQLKDLIEATKLQLGQDSVEPPKRARAK